MQYIHIPYRPYYRCKMQLERSLIFYVLYKNFVHKLPLENLPCLIKDLLHP